MLKWRRKPSLPAVSSSLPDLLGDSTPGLTADTPFSAHTLTGRPNHLSINSLRKFLQRSMRNTEIEETVTLCARVRVHVDSSLEPEKILLTEPVPELGHMEYQLLKLFILLWVSVTPVTAKPHPLAPASSSSKDTDWSSPTLTSWKNKIILEFFKMDLREFGLETVVIWLSWKVFKTVLLIWSNRYRKWRHLTNVELMT